MRQIKLIKTSLFLVLGLFSTNALASNNLLSKNMQEIRGTLCFKEASEKHNVDINVLKAIAKSESNFNEKATATDKGHTTYGVMQVSDVWKPFLAENNLRLSDLYEPCTNIHVGAYLFKKNEKYFNKNWKKHYLKQKNA